MWEWLWERAVGGYQEDAEVKRKPKVPRRNWTENVDFEEIAGEGCTGSKKHVIGNWRKGESCYGAAACLAKVSPAFTGKVETASNDLNDLGKRFQARLLTARLRFFLLGMVK